MPISARHIIVCDEVRIENNGKFLILGMYTPDMGVGQLPFVAPVLTFLLWLQSDRIGPVQFTARLSHLETGQVIAQAMGGMQILRPSPNAGIAGIVPIRLVGVQFSNQGAYTFSLQFEGQTEPVTHTFNVILNVPVMTTTPPGFPGLPGFPRSG